MIPAPPSRSSQGVAAGRPVRPRKRASRFMPQSPGVSPTDQIRACIRAHMDARGLTLQQISDAADYSYAGLHHWLSGRKADITLSTAIRIINACGLQLEITDPGHQTPARRSAPSHSR